MKRLVILLGLLVLVVGAGVGGWLWLSAEDPQEAAMRALSLRLARENEALATRIEAGDKAAMVEMARRYVDGIGVDADPVAGARLLTRAAKAGHPPAQVALGRLLEDGKGVVRDYYRAADWYRTAATIAHDPEAQYRLGEMYLYGRGVSQDYAAAFDWYERAARQGHPAAQYVLGAILEDGWGVARDRVAAWTWYRRALSRAETVKGYNPKYDVPAALAGLEKKMTNFERDQAQKRLATVRQR